jgi:hypothetical protein
MCIFIFSWYREFIIANSSETYPYISIFNKWVYWKIIKKLYIY